MWGLRVWRDATTCLWRRASAAAGSSAWRKTRRKLIASGERRTTLRRLALTRVRSQRAMTGIIGRLLFALAGLTCPHGWICDCTPTPRHQCRHKVSSRPPPTGRGYRNLDAQFMHGNFSQLQKFCAPVRRLILVPSQQQVHVGAAFPQK